MKTTGKIGIAVLCWLAPLGATPAETHGAGQDSAVPAAIGERTERLLALQRGGTAAGNALPIPGGEAERSYKRYLDSFNHPLPDHYLPQGSSGRDGAK